MSEKSKHRLELMIHIAYIGMICLIVYLIIRYALGLILPFLIAFVIVSVIQPLIRRLKKVMKTQRMIVSFLVMLIIYLGVGVGLFFAILNLVFFLRDQFTLLSGYYDTTLAPTMTHAWTNLSEFIDQLPPQWQSQLQAVQDAVMQGMQNFLLSLSQHGLSAVSAFTGGIPAFMITFIFTIMLSFFVSMQYDAVVGFIKLQLPRKALAMLEELRGILRATVLKYLSAYIKLMFITFAELTVGLLVLRTENAVLIALGIAVFDALPLLGTGAVLVPWVLIEAIRGNFAFAVGLVILYAIIVVVRNIIEPKIVGDKLGLNPIVSLMSIYLGFKLVGVLGMISMPIITQIILELHRRGKFRLYQEAAGAPAEQPAETVKTAKKSQDSNP
jgi:sporulation integral membrane protein YtvI